MQWVTELPAYGLKTYMWHLNPHLYGMRHKVQLIKSKLVKTFCIIQSGSCAACECRWKQQSGSGTQGSACAT